MFDVGVLMIGSVPSSEAGLVYRLNVDFIGTQLEWNASGVFSCT